jgi:PAS domain S-box-containing protein
LTTIQGNTEDLNGRDEDTAQDLRQRAEKKVQETEAETSRLLSALENSRLVHELQVHQIELEMQNEELRQSEGSFQRFIENTAIGLYRTTPQGQVLLANPALLSMLGYETFEEMAQHNLEGNYFHQGYERCHFYTLLESQGEVKGFEAAWKKRDGSTIYVRENARVVRDPAGQVLFYEGSVEDITANRQARRALQESEERYRRIVETSHEGVWVRDQNSVTTYVNQRLADMFGYQPEEMIGMLTKSFIPEDELKEHYRQFAERSKGQPGQYEGHYRRKDGSNLWANVSAVPIHDEQGGFAGSYAMLTDITERKLAELELESERKLMNALMDNTADAIYFMDTQLRYLRVSRATALKEGLQQPELMIGKTDFDFFTRQTAQEFADQELEIMRTGLPVLDKEQKEERPDGRTTWASTTEVPLRDASGQIIGVIGISRDITDRKRAEVELERERALMKALMDTSPESIYFKDTQLRFIHVSRATALREGFQKPEDMIGKTDFDFFDRESAQEFYDQEMEIMRTGQAVVNREVNGQRPGQVPRWVSYTEAPLRDAAGQVIGIYAISRDITDRKQAEQDLERERDLLKALMDTSPDSIYFKDTQLRFLRASRSTAQREGFASPEDMIGKTDFDIFDHATAQAYYDNEMEIITSGQPVVNREEKGHLPDGTPRWYLDNELPLRDSAGRVTGVFAVSRDITYLKQTELELERERQLMQALMDNIPDAIYFKDTDLRYLRVSKGAALKEGIQQPESMIGKSDFDYFSQESAQEFYDLEMEIMRTRQPVIGLEQKEQRPGRPPTWASTVELPMYDSGGQVIGVFGITRDITERKKIEQALVASEERLSLALEASNDGLWDQNFVTGQVYVSPRYCTMLGYTPEELLSYENVLEKVCHPDDVQAIRQAEQDYLAGRRENYEVEFRALTKTGEVMWIRSRGKVVEHDGEGRPVRMVGTHVDITQSKVIEAALRESEARFRTLIEQAPVAIGVSRAGLSLYSNQKYQELFGLPNMDAVSGMPISEYYAPQSREYILERLHRTALGLPVPAEFEAVGLRSDGTQFPMQLAISQVKLPDGPVNIAFVTDIGERKKAEEALRRSEAIYRKAIEGADAVPYQQLFSKGSDAGDLLFTFVGEGIRQLTGYGPEEFTDKVFDSMVVESHLIGDLSAYSLVEAVDLVRTGAVPYWKCEWLLRTRDGKLRWVFEAAVDYYDENGIVTSSIGLFQDITARKQAEEALRQSEAIYRKAIEVAEAVPFREVFHDASGSPKTGFDFIGEGIQRLTGYTAAEFTSTLFDSRVVECHLLDELAQYSIKEAITLVRTGALPYWKCEWLFRTRDGNLRWIFEGAVDQVDEHGVAQSSIGLFQDITARKQHEREVEAIAAVSGALRAALSRAEMLPVIIDQVTELFQAGGAALITPDPSSEDMLVEIAQGEFIQILNRRMTRASGVWGGVHQSGEAYLNNNVTEAEFMLSDPANGLHALAAVPLSVKGVSIGVLVVGRNVDISADDLRLLTSIADIAANALYRADLFEQTERRLKYISAVQQIDSAISSSLDLRVTFNVLLARTLEQLHADAGDILLLDPYLHRLEYLSGRGFLTQAIENTHLKLGECIAGRAALERRGAFFQDLAKTTYPVRSGSQLTVENFVAYHALPLIAKGEVKGVLEVFYRNAPTPEADALNLLETISGQAAIAIDNSQLFQSLQHSNMELILAYDATIEGWSHALDLRVKESEGHTHRVTEMAERLAVAIGLSWEEQSQVRRGALLHDIGKMGIPDSILLKETPLTAEETAILHQHPQQAFDMLSPIAYLRRALDIPYCHHESWDGTGYPRRLKGGQIPIAARIFHVVDVWDAITSGRPQQPPFSKEQAIDYIRSSTGTLFDPQVVETFIGMMSDNT